MTAAQCFSERATGKRLTEAEKSFKVGLGKFNKPLYDATDPFIQVYDVKTVKIPANYTGEYSKLAGDVAVVILHKSVRFNHAVRPICLDYAEENMEKTQLVDGARAEVRNCGSECEYYFFRDLDELIFQFPGWGLSLKRRGSNDLKLIDMIYVPRNSCLERTRSNIANDKICAKDERSGKWNLASQLRKPQVVKMFPLLLAYKADQYEDEINSKIIFFLCLEVIICPNDIGGGLVFQDLGIYHFSGVLSMAVNQCQSHEIAFFTKVSKYKDLIEL